MIGKSGIEAAKSEISSKLSSLNASVIAGYKIPEPILKRYF